MTEYQVPFQTVRDLELNGGETALVRTDFNVPMSDDGEIMDDFRIQGSIPTLKYLLDERGDGASLALMSGAPLPGIDALRRR
jgi:phosphoglycerate kinase